MIKHKQCIKLIINIFQDGEIYMHVVYVINSQGFDIKNNIHKNLLCIRINLTPIKVECVQEKLLEGTTFSSTIPIKQSVTEQLPIEQPATPQLAIAQLASARHDDKKSITVSVPKNSHKFRLGRNINGEYICLTFPLDEKRITPEKAWRKIIECKIKPEGYQYFFDALSRFSECNSDYGKLDETQKKALMTTIKVVKKVEDELKEKAVKSKELVYQKQLTDVVSRKDAEINRFIPTKCTMEEGNVGRSIQINARNSFEIIKDVHQKQLIDNSLSKRSAVATK